MNIVTIIEAQEQGLTHYFTGNPCKRKHISKRFTKTRACFACKAEDNKSPENKKYRAKYRAANQERQNEYERAWYHRGGKNTKAKWKQENADKQEGYAQTYHEKHPGRRNEIERRSYQKHSDKRREKSRLYAKEHPAWAAAHAAKRRARKLHATPTWANRDAIQAVYEEAERIQLEMGVPHHVDHIVPLQGDTVCGLHVEGNLQILTEKENLEKSNSFSHGYLTANISG